MKYLLSLVVLASILAFNSMTMASTDESVVASSSKAPSKVGPISGKSAACMAIVQNTRKGEIHSDGIATNSSAAGAKSAN